MRNQAEGTGARGLVHALGGGEADQDLNDMKDDISKINVECYRGLHRQERDKVQHFEDWIRENIMPPRKAPRTRTTPATTTNTTSVTNAQLQAMIDQGVAAALATRDANRSTNGEDKDTWGVMWRG
ncbi:hypothetical protein Tco_1403103 [Tanacetum coccineum]